MAQTQPWGTPNINSVHEPKDRAVHASFELNTVVDP